MGGILVRERMFLVLTSMPTPVLRESCTKSLKDFINGEDGGLSGIWYIWYIPERPSSSPLIT